MKTRKLKSRRPTGRRFSRVTPTPERSWSSKDEAGASSYAGLAEALPIDWALQKSYVFSMVWAWCSQVRLRPQVRIPIPRLFSYRDP